MQLRLLQVLGQQSGNTIVLGLQSPSGPIPIQKPSGAVIDTHVKDSGAGDSDAG